MIGTDAVARHFSVTKFGSIAKYVLHHNPSRRCADHTYKGTLNDSIINFREVLPEAEIKAAFKEGEKGDLYIVLGSSLRVSPANCVPLQVHHRGEKVVVCRYVHVCVWERATHGEYITQLHLLSSITGMLEPAGPRLFLVLPQILFFLSFFRAGFIWWAIFRENLQPAGTSLLCGWMYKAAHLP